MPKAPTSPPLPLNGLFPLAKPSGPPSMRVIDWITPLLLDSKLFDDPTKPRHLAPKSKKKNSAHLGLKIGQGGTLDPLADGVLVIGVNKGTKHLNRFLECSKEYESIGLLGASTTSFDSEGSILSTSSSDHVTREQVEKVLDQFRGKITQVPPIFSALKMDGKPLYEYARESKPLPRAIPSRQCTVEIDLLDFTPAQIVEGDGGHTYTWPTKQLTPEEKDTFNKLTKMVQEAQVKDAPCTGTNGEVTPVVVPDLEAPAVPEVSPKTGLKPATFTIRMTVSSGTYVRSIVHDIGLALGSGAHVVKLTRTRQGEFSLHGDEEKIVPQSSENTTADETDLKMSENKEGPSGGCVPWDVWQRAIDARKETVETEKKELDEAKASGASAEEIDQLFSTQAIFEKRRQGELKEWEVEVLKRFVAVPA